jgi:hypothetical protein
VKKIAGRPRIIKLLCVHNPGVREVYDLGFTKDGTMTGHRQMVKRTLAKRCKIDGRNVATFVLAEPPDEYFSEEDPLDMSLKDNTGSWMLPSKEWLALRDKRIAEDSARASEAKERALTLATNSLATQLGSLVNSVSGTPAVAGKGAR